MQKYTYSIATGRYSSEWSMTYRNQEKFSDGLAFNKIQMCGYELTCVLEEEN